RWGARGDSRNWVFSLESHADVSMPPNDQAHPHLTQTAWSGSVRRAGSSVGCSALLAGVTQFFANDSPKSLLKWLCRVRDIVAKSLVDQSLVVPAASLMHLRFEPVNNVFVQSNRYPGLATRRGDYWASLPFTEIVLFPHFDSS